MRSAATARPSATAARVASAPLWVLAGILAAAFVLRLLFVPADGFSNDVSTFESWSLTLNQYGPRGFYAHAGFADYPPGYFFVLWFVGHVYSLLTALHPDTDYGLLKALVKMPAIVMDLACASLIYVIVKRYATEVAALVAAAIFAFNPSVVFISAYWGQVDSVAAGFTLLALFCLMRAYDATPATEAGWIVAAWSSLAYSILIKPPAAILVALFLAFVFTGDPARRRGRGIATLYGIAAALAIGYVAALVFDAGPGLSPVGQFGWLFQRYAYASSVYPYNSVNAFNLYAVFMKFWQSDTELLPKLMIGSKAVGVTRNLWGVLLLLVAVVLVVSRYLQRKDAPALLEAAMVLSLGFFVLSTRMHERYVFTALALAVPLAVYRRRYLYATVALTLTLFVNLVYSLMYLKAVSSQLPGVDAADLMPALSRPLAALNVLAFFYLGYVYLGSAAAETMEDDRLARLGTTLALAGRNVRGWFSPIEGVARMTPRDWQISVSLSVASFALSFVNYWWPSEKIFDEIYYARAGEEYLTHANVNGFGVFEFTHPPLTKLLITLSMILFGGMPHGDWAGGWRFANLVVGALMVLVCYAFAKRMLASTLFASLAAGFLLFDGFHYVQSRIATPEITVAFFTLTTLYCFYRFWIASQVRVFPQMRAALARREAVWLAGGTALAAVLAYVCTQIGTHQPPRATLLAFVYFELGVYLGVRLLVPKFDAAVRGTTESSYADGTRVVAGRRVVPDGVEPAVVKPGAAFAFARADLRVAYAAGDGPVSYATPDGEATFATDAKSGAATMRVAYAGDLARGVDRIAETLRSDRPQKWMFVLAASGGCLASSKWNGLFDFFVVWLCAAIVVFQPYWVWILSALRFGNPERESGGGGPAVWGNPFGISLDLLVVAMLFVAMTIYVLCYIPFFALGKNLDDLIGLQQQMYWYHSNLKATHPYGSSWWQWPILQRPISYYYHDFRTGAATQDPTACCVAEILALPNPLIWWTGLVSVPFVAYLAWRERHKGFTLLVAAYVLQWLPWIVSPRVAFEYHFFPNLAIICIADAALLQRVWQLGYAGAAGGGAEAGRLPVERVRWPRYVVYGYAVLAVLVFAFFYPVTAGEHVRWFEWDARMLHWLEGVHWV